MRAAQTLVYRFLAAILIACHVITHPRHYWRSYKEFTMTAEDRLARIHEIARDITSRKRAER